MAVADIHVHAPTAFDYCVKYFVIRERSPWRAPVERVRTDAYGVGRHTDAAWAAQKGDWNFDGQVGFEDMNGVLAAFSQQMSGAGPYDPDADFDADGLVGFSDLNKVLASYGQSMSRLADRPSLRISSVKHLQEVIKRGRC